MHKQARTESYDRSGKKVKKKKTYPTGGHKATEAYKNKKNCREKNKGQADFYDLSTAPHRTAKRNKTLEQKKRSIFPPSLPP